MKRIRGFLLPALIAAWVGMAGKIYASDLPAETHPSLLYDSAMVSMLLDRIERPPYDGWWQGVQAAALQGLTFNFSGASETTKSHYCKYLAFAYVITDSLPYAQKCLEGLQLLNPGGNWGAELHNHADPLMCYCEAYDILKGSGFDFGSSEAQIRANLATKAQEFRDNLLILLYANNWRVRYLSALGLAAMTLADLPEAEDWHDWAETMVMLIFNSAQVVGEGAWAEGPNYLLYSADIYLPYMLAFHRLISGADLINEPMVHLTHDWSWKIRLPNGQRPNFEDAHLTYFYGDFLATVHADADVHQWDFLNVGDESNLFAVDHWRVDAICYYDDAVPASPPSISATVFMPEAGHAVFRSGWGWDDVYFFLIGEHGPARTMGLGHDHADATSFILYAYGEVLALDAGYISWTQRQAVNKARNHSLILVDGAGPPSSTQINAGDAEAFLMNFYDAGSLQFCEDSTYYQNVSIRRSALFVDSSFIVLRDRVISAASRTYDWRLHGNGGGSSGGAFQPDPDGATWSRDGAVLQVLVNASNPVTVAARPLLFSTTLDTHSFASNQILTHQTLNARIMAPEASFLAALYPYPAAGQPPIMERILVSLGSASRVGEGVAWTSPGNTSGEFNGELEGFGLVKFLGDWFYLGMGGEDLSLLHLSSCQTFSFRDTPHFWADQPVTAALDRTGSLWKGHLSAGGEYQVLIFVGNASPAEVRFNGVPTTFTYFNQSVRLDLENSGYLEIEFEQVAGQVAPETSGRDLAPLHTPFSLRAKCESGNLLISFELARAGTIRLSVSDLLGRVIENRQESNLPAGAHAISVDSTPWANGIYFIRLESAGDVSVQKAILMK